MEMEKRETDQTKRTELIRNVEAALSQYRYEQLRRKLDQWSEGNDHCVLYGKKPNPADPERPYYIVLGTQKGTTLVRGKSREDAASQACQVILSLERK